MRRLLPLLALLLCIADWRLARALPPATVAPPSLRACCYLGHHAATRVGPLHTPVAFANVTALDELRAHAYGDRSVLSERNGLVYTCAGGVIDVGHVRNAADWSAHLLPLVRATLGTRRSHTLHHELGRVQLELVPRRGLDADREPLARAVALRVAYELGLWHELVTFHFAGRVPVFSEQFSAFSPEDLYSDRLGAELGIQAATSPLDYDEAMSETLVGTLRGLGALSAGGTRRALDQLAGQLWDPDAVVPEAGLLMTRVVPASTTLEPWRVSDGDALGCGLTPAVDLELPERVDGHAVVGLYRLTFDVTPTDRAVLLGEASGVGPVSSADLPRALARVRGDSGTATFQHAAASGRAPRPTDEATRWTRWRRTPLGDAQGLRALQLAAFGGAAFQGRRLDEHAALWGGRVVGLQADTVGGGAFVMHYASAWSGPDRGLVHHLTGVQSRAQFFCRDRESSAWHAPVLAWFKNCAPRGWLGVGATLLQAQHDGATGRTVVRPAEAALAINLLRNAFDLSFLRRHLVLTLGAGVDSVSGLGGARAHVAPRGVGTLSGVVRSGDAAWELDAHLGARQSVLARRDLGAEAKLALWRHVTLREGAGSRSPRQGVIGLGLEAGGAWWGVPERSLPDALAPLVSDRERLSAYALGVMSLSIERLTF